MNIYESLLISSLLVSLYNIYIHNKLKEKVDITEMFLMSLIADKIERDEDAGNE
jgi:hypothetical protein